METDLADDQHVLVDASARFAEAAHPLTALRDGSWDEPSVAARYLRQAGELGWFSLVVAEEFGGGTVSGNGVVDAALVAMARGRLLQPGPFVGTNVVARALSTGGTAEHRRDVLPTLMSGDASAAWATAAGPGTLHLGGVANAAPAGGGYVLSGRATMVEDPGPNGWFLVTAATADGPSQFLVAADTPSLIVTPRSSLDLSRRLCELHLDGVELPAGALVGAAGGAADAIADQLALASTLLAAESVGSMQAEFEMTLQYAKDRIAFGRPIGSFQAIKHQLADTSLALEMCIGLVLAAADHLGDTLGLGGPAATMAKAFVGDAGIELAQTCFQVFGGIGFTWEHDQHLYLRRLTTDAALYGDPNWHREHLCVLAGV